MKSTGKTQIIESHGKLSIMFEFQIGSINPLHPILGILFSVYFLDLWFGVPRIKEM